MNEVGGKGIEKSRVILIVTLALVGVLAISNVWLFMRVTTLENRTWHEVYSLYSSSSVTTGTFQLVGRSVRVMWSASAIDPQSSISFRLYYSNGTFFGVWGSSGVHTANNAELELNQAGDYFLDIICIDTNYYVSVWDYY